MQALFEEQGTVRSVRMRRHLRSGDFKGSVFVEFDTEELAKEVREMRRSGHGGSLGALRGVDAAMCVPLDQMARDNQMDSTSSNETLCCCFVAAQGDGHHGLRCLMTAAPHVVVQVAVGRSRRGLQPLLG